MHENYYGSAFVFSQAAWMIPMASGTLSAISSILIMSIVLRSSRESRFSSYHIIMIFMSFWDAIASIAIALTTIPMPSDVHEVYPFKGKAYGNVGTCEAQGFLISLGTYFAVSTNCALNVYYLCAIRYGMTEDKIKRKVLPIMLLVCISLSVPVPITGIKMDRFIPAPFTNTCSSVREDKSGSVFNLIGVASLCGCFFIIFVSLGLVVVTVFDTEMAIRRTRRSRRIGLRSRYSALPEVEFIKTRAVLLQACMYVAAFLLTWVWLIVSFIQSRGAKTFEPDRSILIAISVFRPLQGFFNALIFIYQKAYSLREANRELRFSSAVMQVIVSPSIVPDVLISGIERVEGDRRVLDTLHLEEDNSNQLIHDPNDEIELGIDAASAASESNIAPPLDSLENQVSSISTPSVNLDNSSGHFPIFYSGRTRLASVAEEDEDSYDNEDFAGDNDPAENA